MSDKNSVFLIIRETQISETIALKFVFERIPARFAIGINDYTAPIPQTGIHLQVSNQKRKRIIFAAYLTMV